ncbi:FHF complex subunit HOOK interacting protein 2B isoform X2 [Hemicordylus capensis]|nr:FHF complex subunit HOOK interacting protein 2B isoform X2 [Hemicordylus capensis]XP_053124914.1 FHF complex subunit HOOK interacting protein 2B isoform X2 [Hemicordylus capensis]XP_053124915.1 FHF complex subunit HOOK interacting protein 2B isoform X2 [Hemicordylus capensis]XP_053124916.1 FHF complex subunit HOOK interacting protein 2B isoform X2 [Hemicordylus capensis]
MLDILVYEEKQPPAGETGPCLEYLLQHKVLETLSTLAKAEYPPGMRSQVLLFFSRLLGQMQCPLLHYLNVHRPVQKLLQLGSDALGPEPEKEALQFVAVLCAKIRQDPALLPHVLEGKRMAGGQSMDLPLQPQGAATQPLGSAPEGARAELGPGEAACAPPIDESASPTLSLVTSLIHLCKSKKKKVALRAQENLLLLTSIDHQTAALALTRDGVLCRLVAGHLCSLYDAIPAGINPADVAALQPVSWKLQGSSAEESSSFPGQADLEAFFGWLDLCDCLVKEAPPLVADVVSAAVGRRLFLGSLQPQLLQMSERGVLLATALLIGLVRSIRAPALLRELVGFVLGAERMPEDSGRQQQQQPPQPPHPLCSQLIERCNHLSDEISTATLRLFEELLWLPDQRVVQSLVLHHLEERSYLLRSPSGQEEPGSREPEPCEDGLELEEDPYFMDGFPHGGLQASLQPGVLPAPAQPAQPEGKRAVKEVVSSFLCLVPSEAKTSAYLEEAGHDTYVHDASGLFQECCANAARWSWPRVPLPLESCTPGLSFHEGHLLKVLFDRLAHILDQPYAVNLQVTSVLSRLALLPHPHLHEYLLDPYLPLAPGCRNLFSVLIRVIGDLMQRIHRVPDFPAHLLLVRRGLMGLLPEEQAISHRTFLEGVVVLEEFCKELAAIVFVKSAPEGPA